MTAPTCTCHGEPQRWNKDSRYRGGGYWRCAVKHREWAASPQGRASGRRYRESPHGALTRQLLGMTRTRVHY